MEVSPFWKTVIFWVVAVIHSAIVAWLLVAPFLGSSVKYLMFVGMVFVALALQRVLVGVCVLTVIEHWANPELVPSTDVSWTQTQLYHLFGKSFIHFVFQYLGLVYLGVVAIRLWYAEGSHPRGSVLPQFLRHTFRQLEAYFQCSVFHSRHPM